MSSPVLRINDLSIAYRFGSAWLYAVRDVSLDIFPGQTYGLVGESGSGKTTLAMAVMRYLDRNGKVRKGEIAFMGQDILSLRESEMRKIWGAQMSLVPQNPRSSLNPSLRVGEQLAEGLRLHRGSDLKAARRQAVELLEMVRISDPERAANSYPHQMSGGMQQRVLIAQALSTEPGLLVLDEPTTGLDATTQASILDLIRELIADRQTSVLYVSHNLGVIAQICDRVAVLYAGELVEDAAVEDLFRQPLHPYTQGLLDSVPRLGENKADVRVRAVSGEIPRLEERPQGCVFAHRCPLAIEICSRRPPLYIPAARRPETRRRVRCHRWEETAAGLARSEDAAGSARKTRAWPSRLNERVLELQDVQVDFPIRRSIGEWLARKPRRAVHAVGGISVPVWSGKTLGLVGESGSGKTTLARAIVGLTPRTAGEIELAGFPLPKNLSRRSLDTLRRLQMVFQNPEEALNPYLTIGASLTRPIKTLLGKSNPEAKEIALKLLNAVRLPADFFGRLPGQLSGGEKQRVAIARAVASNPELLIADEPVSSLDVSVQASILKLLNQLQEEQNHSMLFISHDLAVVGYLADEVAVIYLGFLMELAPARALFEPPYHPYTEALLSAVPLIDPFGQQKQIRLAGEVPSAVDIPSGCPFHTRCPRFLGEICVKEKPPWRIDAETGKRIYCHIPIEALRSAQEKVFHLQRWKPEAQDEP